MKYNSERHYRRSIRSKGYDYSQPGAYFVTICTEDREFLFGGILNEKVHLNGAGKMIEKWWCELKNKFGNVELDAFVIMPNHIHGIINIVGADLRVCPDGKGEHIGSPLHKIVQWFKTMTTNEYIRGVKNKNWKPFKGKLWQRNYYEHIIRNENELNKIREYIINNPLQWQFDRENPESCSTKNYLYKEIEERIYAKE